MTAAPHQPPGLAVQGGTVPQVTAAAVAAERAGFRSVWSTEFYNRSAVVTLAALAAVTTRIELGSSVAWAFGRTPVTLATDFRSLADLAGGRLSMGIGTGNPQVIADWHGIVESHPVARMVETVELVREIWRIRDRPVAHDGRFFRCHLPADPGLPPLPGGPPPVLMAGGRRPLIRAAGAVADGLVGLPLATRRYVEEVVRPTLAEGARRAGRPETTPITGLVVCVVSDDPGRARRSAALQLAAYATRDSADTALAFEGFTAEAAAIRHAFAARDFPGMAAAVSERMLDSFAVFGTPQEARERFHARFASLYEHPLLYATDIGQPPGFLVENLAAICETFARVPV